jgi:hypothetical protein
LVRPPHEPMVTDDNGVYKGKRSEPLATLHGKDCSLQLTIVYGIERTKILKKEGET